MKSLRPISSTYGKIETVLFTHPGTKWTKEAAKTYENIIRSFDPDVNFIFFSLVEIPERLAETYTREKSVIKTGLNFLQPEPISLEEQMDLKVEEIESGINALFDKLKSEKSAGFIGRKDPTVLVKPRINFSRYFTLVSGRTTKMRHYSHSIWAQDPFWVLQNDQYSALVEPLDPSGLLKLGKPPADTFVADHLASSLEIEEKLGRKFLLMCSSYMFQGGNMLCGTQKSNEGSTTSENTFLLIGNADLKYNVKDEIERLQAQQARNTENNAVVLSAQQTAELENEISDYFKNWFHVDEVIFTPGKTVREKGNNDQPLLHIDQYINLPGAIKGSGKEVILVADLTLGFDTFTKAIEKDLPPKDKNEKRKYPKFFEVDKDLIARLDDTATELSQLMDDNGETKFHVIRIPLLVINYAGIPYVLTYNNCFIEIYDDTNGNVVKKAYLPDYTAESDWTFKEMQEHPVLKKGFQAVMDLVTKVYESLGYSRANIKFIKGEYTKKAKRRGSMHCIAKILERSDY